jgi:hypothetical protein
LSVALDNLILTIRSREERTMLTETTDPTDEFQVLGEVGSEGDRLRWQTRHEEHGDDLSDGMPYIVRDYSFALRVGDQGMTGNFHYGLWRSRWRHDPELSPEDWDDLKERSLEALRRDLEVIKQGGKPEALDIEWL